MNHTLVASSTCESCHNGSYAAAQAKPTNHIPVAVIGALDCKSCHTSTSTWTTEKMNHNGITTGCKTCHATGTSYLGSMQKKSVTHQSKTATDCSQSGCHKPLGNKGTLYKNWD
jgi:hypothetical protein